MVRTATRLRVFGGLMGLLLWATPALAQDDLDPFLSDDDEIEIELGDPGNPDTPEDPDTPEEPDKPKLPDDVGDPTDTELDFKDPLDEDLNLLGDDPEENVEPGKDTAAVYRMTLDAGKKLDIDEEMQLWDRYLEKYPATAFRQQIEVRQQELEDQLYNIDVNREPTGTTDAEDKSFAFSHGVLLENINPRNRLLALVEWGLPDYASLALDIEKELRPGFSVHGGFRRRFTGLSLEGGARYALVRSPRTSTLLTAMFDIRLNTTPAFVAFRPMIGFGKRAGKFDFQGQIGLELAPRQTFDVRGIGGVNVTYRASDAVGLFTETALYIHTISAAAGPYRFNQFVFGMKFLPAQNRENPEDIEISIATTLPFSSAYWQFHYGSLVGQLVLAF